MATDQRWKWAGIVSVVSIAGVLITDIVANVVGGYISDQLKASWLMPGDAPAPTQTAEPDQDMVVSSIPAAPKQAPQSPVGRRDLKTARERDGRHQGAGAGP